jgi:hypothetical protein
MTMRRREEEFDIMAIVGDIADRYPTKIHGRPSLGARADIVVSKGSKKIAIELKNRPITLLDIRQLLQSRYAYRVIAVSSDGLMTTSGSVLDYAERAKITICDLNELPFLIDRL